MISIPSQAFKNSAEVFSKLPLWEQITFSVIIVGSLCCLLVGVFWGLLIRKKTKIPVIFSSMFVFLVFLGVLLLTTFFYVNSFGWERGIMFFFAAPVSYGIVTGSLIFICEKISGLSKKHRQDWKFWSVIGAAITIMIAGIVIPYSIFVN